MASNGTAQAKTWNSNGLAAVVNLHWSAHSLGIWGLTLFSAALSKPTFLISVKVLVATRGIRNLVPCGEQA